MPEPSSTDSRVTGIEHRLNAIGGQVTDIGQDVVTVMRHLGA
jgi:hypothetical protein